MEKVYLHLVCTDKWQMASRAKPIKASRPLLLAKNNFYSNKLVQCISASAKKHNTPLGNYTVV